MEASNIKQEIKALWKIAWSFALRVEIIIAFCAMEIHPFLSGFGNLKAAICRGFVRNLRMLIKRSGKVEAKAKKLFVLFASTYREWLQPYYSASLPCSHYKCSRCKQARLLYVSETPRARRNSSWCGVTAASDILAEPLRKLVIEEFLDEDACLHHRAALQGTLWESLNRNKFLFLNLSFDKIKTFTSWMSIPWFSDQTVWK